MTPQPVLIAGQWRPAVSSGTFQSEDPSQCQLLPDLYPISSWDDCESALEAAYAAAAGLKKLPPERLADFLEEYARRIEATAEALVAMAHSETGLPAAGRLAGAELPRTTGQLRQAAAAAREGSWQMATIDSKQNIRSYLAPLGPVCVFGPNNFPFAFGSISGGDFAAAIASGNPVIAKANSSHPGTTRLFAVAAQEAADKMDLPPGTVQLIYRLGHADGERLVSDHRVGATAYTGSRVAGLKLKGVADAAGKPIYLELSSVNPVVILPGAIAARGDQIADEFSASCLMGSGQLCTNPGVVLLLGGGESENFISKIVERFRSAPTGTLLSSGVAESLEKSVYHLMAAGAECLVGGKPIEGSCYSYANTLLRVTAKQFLEKSKTLQTEAFGNASMLIVADSPEECKAAIDRFEGNLTGCIYSDTAGSDDAIYDELAPRLRERVGRLLNDKMPTGVAVSPAMNHGGPFPATGHPGFTAVGIPAALRRFAMLQCYDNVRPNRLPAALQDQSPNPRMWRLIDGAWSQGNVGS